MLQNVCSKGKKEAEDIFVKAPTLKVYKFIIPKGILVVSGMPIYDPGMALRWPEIALGWPQGKPEIESLSYPISLRAFWTKVPLVLFEQLCVKKSQIENTD